MSTPSAPSTPSTPSNSPQEQPDPPEPVSPARPRPRYRPLSSEEFAELRKTARLGIPDFLRIPAASFVAFFCGMSLGLTHGSKMAGFRFRAEHAHKLPTTTTGWYLYHKSKNYHMAFGGIKEGVKMGTKVGFWTTAMFAIENMFDSYRGSKDLINTTLASVTVAGAFSLWNRFPLIMAARTTKTALIVGLGYGGLQDLVGALRGRPIGYVEYIRGRFIPDRKKSSPSLS